MRIPRATLSLSIYSSLSNIEISLQPLSPNTWSQEVTAGTHVIEYKERNSKTIAFHACADPAEEEKIDEREEWKALETGRGRFRGRLVRERGSEELGGYCGS